MTAVACERKNHTVVALCIGEVGRLIPFLSTSLLQIEAGSTIVRVGSSIFGARAKKPTDA